MKAIPSVKTLLSITTLTPDTAALLRKVLEAKTGDELNALGDHFPATDAWIKACYNHPQFHDIKMHMADEVAGTYGVECIPKGHNERSPAIEYLNTGDTYKTTLMYVNGRYRVGCWGDIVERGHYD